jgi:hypothetical protein
MEPKMQTTTCSAVAASLARWHQALETNDLTVLPNLLHQDVVFRSPVAFKPYQGSRSVALILNTVWSVFRDFAYEREFVADDGLSVALEFGASVGDKQLKGIDLIRFDEEGRIVEFEVMIRPFSALQALGEEMSKRLASAPPSMTGGTTPSV